MVSALDATDFDASLMFSKAFLDDFPFVNVDILGFIPFVISCCASPHATKSCNFLDTPVGAVSAALVTASAHSAIASFGALFMNDFSHLARFPICQRATTSATFITDSIVSVPSGYCFLSSFHVPVQYCNPSIIADAVSGLLSAKFCITDAAWLLTNCSTSSGTNCRNVSHATPSIHPATSPAYCTASHGNEAAVFNPPTIPSSSTAFALCSSNAIALSFMLLAALLIAPPTLSKNPFFGLSTCPVSICRCSFCLLYVDEINCSISSSYHSISRHGLLSIITFVIFSSEDLVIYG